MKRTLQVLLIGSLLGACSPLPARTVNMFDYHGITWRDTLTLAQSGYTYATAKAQFTAWVGYMEYKGASSKVLDIRKFAAAYEDIIWRNDQWAAEGNGNNAYYPDGLQSRVNIKIPYGCYRTDIPLTLPNGIIQGEGTGNVLFERRWDGTQGGTTISLDNAGWDGDAAKHYVFKSWNYGIPGGSVAYHESFQILDLRLEGGDGGPHKTAYEAAGIVLWKTGETSLINNVFVEGFNGYGIRIDGATPLTIDNLSVFHNSLAGIYMTGCWGASINIGTLSNDDGGTLLLGRPGYGQDGATSVTEAGGNINIELIKNEAFNKSEGPNHQWRGTVIADLEGQFNVTIGAVQSGMGGGRVHALFVVRPYLTNGDRQSSILKVGTIRGWNYDAALHVIDGANTCEYLSPGDNVGYDFTWASHGAGAFTSIIPLTKRSITCQARLGWARGTGVISSANCTPAYSYTTGASGGSAPPVACTGWTTTTYVCGSCVGGSKPCTRTVTASPAGCTGTPPGAKPTEAEGQACTVTPPPTSGLVFATTFAGTGPNLVATTGTTIAPGATWSNGTFSNGTITTNRNTSYPWTGTALKVVVVGYTATGTGSFNYGRITDIHEITPNGNVIVNQSGKPTVATGITLVKGTRYASLTLPVPAGYTLGTVVGGKLSGGSTQPATCEGMEVWR